MIQHVYESLEEAKRHEEGQQRVYRVTHLGRTLYVVALSPRHAMGYAGPHFELKADLVDTRVGRVSVDELVEWMSPEQRKALLEKLNATAG